MLGDGSRHSEEIVKKSRNAPLNVIFFFFFFNSYISIFTSRHSIEENLSLPSKHLKIIGGA